MDAGEGLAKVLSYYNLPVDKMGSYKIICPFHEDKNPSMVVDLKKGNWYCFGCGLSGDGVRFVKELEERRGNHLNDIQAYQKYLSIQRTDKKSSIVIPGMSSVSLNHRDASRRQLYDEAYDYYHGLSKVNWRTSEDLEVIEARDYMEFRGFGPDILNEVGAKVTYNNSYPIIFPMKDRGKFKGWVCRTMNPFIESKRKYLYNAGFRRALTLVGDYGDKFEDERSEYVFVVEGYMDRLKFLQFGVKNVVAILGWKASDDQIRKLKDQGITEVISALDHDDCGRKGTRYLRQFFNVTRFCYLKGIKDPGDMDQASFERMFKRTMEKFKKERNERNGNCR